MIHQCFEDFEKCPLRIYDLEKDILRCDFFRQNSILICNRQLDRKHALVNKACDYIKKEEARLDSIVAVSHKRNLDFLKKAQIGETVYCRIGYPEVKLLEKPLNLQLSCYCKCQKKDGIIFDVHVSHLHRISKSDYYGEHFINGIDNKEIAQELKSRANYYGFRVKFEERDKGYLLKIYGDTQQEVDDFINHYIKQDRELIF